MSKTTIQASNLKENLENQDSVNGCWRHLSIGKTETSEKSSLSLLQRTARRRSNHHRTLPRSNQVWNAVNIAYFRGQMLWVWWWWRPWGKRAHHWWMWISMAGRSSRSLCPRQHQITLQENQMLRSVQRWWNSSIQQQTFLQWHAQAENQIPTISNQTSGWKLPTIHLQHVARWTSQNERHQQHRTTPRCPLKHGTSFHACCRHQTCLGNQRKPAFRAHLRQTKPTTEVSKRRENPHQSMLQSHPFRSLQKNV